jgi:5-methylcytosine-specific restriction endonuclease McrA
MRKISDKGLRKKLDDLVRAKVRKRDKNRCVWCGKPVEGINSQVSHVIPKGRSTFLRWDMKNVKLLCMYCHIEKWHKRAEGRQWFDKKYPERAKYVDKHQRKLVKKRAFMEETLERLQNGKNNSK